MAVYTAITDGDVEAHLLKYDIGKLRSLKGIAEGVQNSNYLLSTTKGQFILTLYEQMVAEADLPFYIGLMEHLAANGFNCPEPKKLKSGKTLTTLCGRPSAIVSFLDGISVSEPTPQHCEQLGQKLAQMHLVTASFDMYLDNALSQSKWRNFYNNSIHRADEIEPVLPEIIAHELDYLAVNWPTDIPSGVTHTDLFPDNVFFLDGELSGFIDFYFAANDLLAYDLAVSINAWCFNADNHFIKQNAAAMLKGYNEARPLLSAEAEALPALCRGASLRFLLTRIHDWHNVPPDAVVTPHDPLVFLTRLKFHQNISHYSEYGFEA